MTKQDSSNLIAGSIRAPIFQNFAAVLNIEDFRGQVEVKQCTIGQNMINVPDILFTDDNERIDSEKINIEYYFNTKSNLYEMAKCSRNGEGTGNNRKDFYLLRDGLRGILQNR